MNISAVLLARAIAIFEVAELSPSGRVFVPALVPLVAERFKFQSFPSKIEDFDASKGITFKAGYFNGFAVDELAVYNDGIKIDLTSNTRDAKEMVIDTLKWLAEKASISYVEGMVKRWGLLSQVVFHSEMDLDGISRAVGNLGCRTSAKVSERVGTSLEFRAAGLHLNFDRTMGELPIAPFLIERRAKTPFSEKKYFSQAPLDTEDHILLLEEFERELSGRRLRKTNSVRS